MPLSQIVEYNDFAAGFKKLRNQMAADISRAACHQIALWL
jgi:hypothetical protein